jgi:hypothetical protein
VANFEFQIFGDSVCFENTSLRAETVLWNFGNGGQSSEFSPCYDYMDFQIFTAKLYVFNDYGSDEIEKEVDLLGLEEVSTRFEVYPNPTSRIVYFNEVTDVALYDALGKIVRVERNTKSMDIMGMEPGTYYIKNAAGQTKKLIIQ